MGNIAEALASEEARSEVADLLHAMFAEPSKPELITAVLEHEPALALEGLEWGFSDTVVREGFMSATSNVLLGVDWPTFGELHTAEGKERYSDFDERILTAARDFAP